MSLYKGSIKIAGNIEQTLTQDISDKSVQFNDENSISGTDFTTSIQTFKTGDQLSNIFRSIKVSLIKLFNFATNIYGYATDLNNPVAFLSYYDKNSNNSPYSKNMTLATQGIVLSVHLNNASYNSQLAICTGTDKIYIRYCSNNTWSNWIEK